MVEWIASVASPPRKDGKRVAESLLFNHCDSAIFVWNRPIFVIARLNEVKSWQSIKLKSLDSVESCVESSHFRHCEKICKDFRGNPYY